MSSIPDNVRQILHKLVPAAIINEIACFAFYDHHPRDDKNIDITICTKRGEVREYYQKDLISSVLIPGAVNPTELRILRNGDCTLFYLISSDDELIILSGRKKLQIQQRVTNVERFDAHDFSCNGQACLKIVQNDDAVPLILDDNFKEFKRQEISQTYTESVEEECLPIITHLKRKLTEARYSIKCNEKSYKELTDLRQMAAFYMYRKMHPNLDDSLMKCGLSEMVAALKIKFQAPWVKVCNKKIVIAFFVNNKNDEPLEDIHTLLHGTTMPTLVYTTKLFERTDIPPFWKENQTQTITHKKETAIVVVMELKEIKHNVTSKIEFNGVIFYTKSGKECLLPTENVMVSSTETMGPEFDVLSSDETDSNTMLAILATTEKNNLILRYIKKNDDKDVLGMDIFCKYLGMERVKETENIVIYRKSPYHVLNGVMIIAHTEWRGSQENCLKISVYSRSPSQVLAMIHYIHDAIPLTIIATTPNYRMTAKDDQLTAYNQDTQQNSSPTHNYTDYVPSLLERSRMILEYLDNSMIKMNESKNPAVLNKVGTEIDLLAGGLEKYLEFRSNMLEKANEGLKMTSEDYSSNIDTMVID